jgi:hypothetical protein
MRLQDTERISVCSMVAKTGLTADGFSRLAALQLSIHTSPRPAVGWNWLVMAINTASGLVEL